MAQPARAGLESGRGSFVTWFTFGVGVPAGIATLYLIENGPWQNATLQRYVHHEAEQIVVVLFFCCLASLLGKFLMATKERLVHTQKILPTWDGKPIPAAEITQLQQSLHLVWDSAKNSVLARRIAAILNFVASRGSADDLDDQMRTLADNDAIALDGSYAVNRFLIWAMPILGFLGTVLGITEAIANISPEQLEKGGADGVTQGLTKAFDATALALGLTLVAMFVNSLIEKLEQSLLERVDSYVDAELAHRFIRHQGEMNHPGTLTPALQLLIEKQIASFQKAEERWAQQGPQGQQDKWAAALQQALDGALTRFGQRIVETEKKLLERQHTMIETLAKLAQSLKETDREHQAAVARLTDAIGLSVEMIAKMQTSETQLVRLQETLSQNLALLANSATFEQAVESLTAAIHLLTTRVNPAQGATPRIVPMTKGAA